MRTGRSRTLPAGTRSGPTSAGQPGCAAPPPHRLTGQSAPLSQERDVDELPGSDLRGITGNHHQAVGFGQ